MSGHDIERFSSVGAQRSIAAQHICCYATLLMLLEGCIGNNVVTEGKRTQGAETEPANRKSKSVEAGTVAPKQAPAGSDAASPTPAQRSPGASCWFEYLGPWIRCEGAELNEVPQEVSSLQECADACAAAPECNAVVDYFWLGLEGATCSTHIGKCNAPTDQYWAEGSGGKEYRKRCGAEVPKDAITHFEPSFGTVVDPASGCVFKWLAGSCDADSDGGGGASAVGAETLDDCFAQCQARKDCSGVKDWLDGKHDGLECVLTLTDCENPSEEADPLAYHYKKFCDETAR
jgi:hypothetical protein